jgi:hypothetical protein
MPEHRCTYDSDYGFFRSTRGRVFLMCSCGRWAEEKAGRWRYIGLERTPAPCQTLTFFQRLFSFFTAGEA